MIVEICLKKVYKSKTFYSARIVFIIMLLLFDYNINNYNNNNNKYY